jgi:pimeloyl-ACP methyl ester carboxylesterase
LPSVRTLAVAVPALAAMAALAAAAAPATPPPPAPRLVDVGGHRLDVLRAGSGSPVVVFEAGLGDSLEAWERVWPAVAGTTEVVVYSRSGLGRSERGPHPHTARGAAEELHALLGSLGVATPRVLVGASYGGLLVRLYTSLHTQDVAGLVLVEGVHEQQVQRYGLLDPGYPAAFRRSFDERLATLPPGGEADEIRETVRIQAAGAVEGMTPLPDVPIAVLTSMKSDPAAPYVNGTPRGHEVWRALHDEWFQRARDGEHLETSGSGHHIQDEEPELVIGAVRFVLERVHVRVNTGRR